MPNSCCAYNCTVTSDVFPDLKFHLFPNESKQKERRLKWTQALKRKNFVPSKNTKLCSRHFQPSDYEVIPFSGKLRLKADAVPSIFDFPDHMQRKQVVERRPLVRITPNEGVDHDENNSLVPMESVEAPICKTVETQTTLTGIELDETLYGLRREIKCLQQKIRRRDQRIANTMVHSVSHCPQCDYEIVTIPCDVVE